MAAAAADMEEEDMGDMEDMEEEDMEEDMEEEEEDEDEDEDEEEEDDEQEQEEEQEEEQEQDEEDEEEQDGCGVCGGEHLQLVDLVAGRPLLAPGGDRGATCRRRIALPGHRRPDPVLPRRGYPLRPRAHVAAAGCGRQAAGAGGAAHMAKSPVSSCSKTRPPEPSLEAAGHLQSFAHCTVVL